MCGIIGILSNNFVKSSKLELTKSMIASINHRGPDGWGVYASDEISLGHSRLSIIDLDGGHQPMASNRYVISFNGEIYNYIELRQQLISMGAIFDTKSDTEVILKAFEFFGIDAVKHFNGQFAFILWDKLEKKVIISRDRYGIRPLYILHFENSFFFSSEVKAFDHIPGYKRSFDRTNLFEHGLFWNTLGDKTVFKGIRALQSGTIEIYKNNEETKSYRYYEIGESEYASPSSFDDALDDFFSILRDSVKLRLRSDVPVANYLSGGIDSSVISLLTKQLNSKFVKTFSISFEDTNYDESSFQKEMVNLLGADHLERKISYNSIRENIVASAYHFERPVFRLAPVPLYLLSSDVSNSGIKVVLTGEAADEILFGYDSYKELILLKFWRKYPESELRPLLIKTLYPHLRHYSDSAKYGMLKLYYKGFLNNFDNIFCGLNIRMSNNKILSNLFSDEQPVSLDIEKYDSELQELLPENYDSWSILQKNQFLEMKTLLSGYLLSSQGDRMSLAHGVEGRYPFLDHRLVEKAFYYNDSYKLNGFNGKYILKRLFQDQIPHSIINRPKLPYQAPDLISFFVDNKPSEEIEYFLSEKLVKKYGIFNYPMVKKILSKALNQKTRNTGYRDNMLLSFLLSAQIISHWIDNPKTNILDEKHKTVELVE